MDASLQAAMELFKAARPSVGEMIKHKKDNLAKDIQGVMLNKYSCVLKEITSTLSQGTVLRKQLVEFSNKYMEQITRDNIKWFNAFDDCEEIEKVIDTLKAYYGDVENVINAEYEKYFNSLREDKDEEWVLEVKWLENATKAERDLLILQYKALFLEFVVFIERYCEFIRNRPKLRV